MRKHTFYLFFIVVFIHSNKSHAQFLDTLELIFKNKSSIDVRLESRNSFIENGRALITGVRAGIAFQRKLRIGGGVSWLKSDVSDYGYNLLKNNKNDSGLYFLKLAYLCYYIDFVFHKTKRWQLSVPIQVGTGMHWFQSTKPYRLSGPEKKRFLLLYEPGISTQFKIFRWFGLGADVGYRFTLKNNKYVGNKFNSPTYAFKILFWLDQLYFQTFPKSKITEKYGPAVW